MQPEYKDIRDGDWQSLRQFVRRANERLSVLEGHSGESTRFANLKLDGNQLRNGPFRQSVAADDEFITKHYLDKRLIIASNAPPNISSVTSHNLPTGGTVNTITPQIFTDFTDDSLWIPVWPDPAVVTMAMNTDGSVSLTSAAQATNKAVAAGIRSLFKLYPDQLDGTIQVRVKFSPMSLTSAASSTQQWGFYYDISAAGMTGGWAGSVVQIGGPNNFIAMGLGNDTAPWSTSFAGGVINLLAGNHPATSLELRQAYTRSAAAANYLLATLEYNVDGGGFLTLDNADQGVSGKYAHFGIPLFVGVFGANTASGCSGTIKEVEIIKGFGQFG